MCVEWLGEDECNYNGAQYCKHITGVEAALGFTKGIYFNRARVAQGLRKVDNGKFGHKPTRDNQLSFFFVITLINSRHVTLVLV